MYFAGDRSRAIGCIYTFRYKGRSFFYQSGFDRTWDQWSVGTVLVSYCIKESIRDGLDEFHYLRGAEAYKFRWTEKVIKTRTIILVNKTLPAMAYSSKLHVKTVLKTLKTTLNSMIAGSKTHV
jgi:CelD/BcsL family acetyltransferase involved in cellulose biosynthesis